MSRKKWGFGTIRNKISRVSTLITRLNRHFQQRLHNPDGRSCPAFLVGSGRSGTNMLAASLAKSWQVELYNEDNPAAFEKWFLKDFVVIDSLIADSYAPVVLFKPIKDTYRTQVLLSHYTNSKAIFIFRQFDDLINSALKRFYDKNGLVIKPVFEDRRTPVARWMDNDFAEFSNAPPPEVTRQFVRSLWKPSLNLESQIALDWLFTNRLYFDNGLCEVERVYLVSYEKLVMEPETVFQSLCEFLDLSYDPQIAKDIFTSSIKRDAAPDIDPQIREECHTLWQRLCSHTWTAQPAAAL